MRTPDKHFVITVLLLSFFLSGCFAELSTIKGYGTEDSAVKNEASGGKEVSFEEFDLASANKPLEMKFRTNDKLRVSVWGYPELTHNASILSDGNIILPLVGEIKAVNRTAREIREDIKSRMINRVNSREPVRLDYGDELTMMLWNHPEISVTPDLVVTSAVQQDGAVTFPLVGQVKASGKTLDQITRHVRKKLYAFLPDPIVTIRPEKLNRFTVPNPQVFVLPLETHQEQVAILGDVNKPGIIPIKGKLRLMTALALANYTNTAALNHIVVIRNPEGDKPLYRQIRIKDYLDKSNLSQNIYLADNDIVFVPKNAIGKVGEFIQKVFSNTMPVFQWWIWLQQAKDIEDINDAVIRNSEIIHSLP